MSVSSPSAAQDWQHLLKNFLEDAVHPLVVILGPTASGKTSFAIEIARECSQAEIVNADSRQLYRYLDIGTAKIMREEMCGVPHHLIDVLDPKEEVTAAWYKEHAQAAIDEILQRGNVPLLVGGSMLYLSAVVDDLRFPSNADPAIRRKLEAEYASDDGKRLHERLTTIDPETANLVHPHNKPYLIRALEIAESTGKAPSVARTKGRSRYDLLIFGMACPRDELADRIRRRTHSMFEEGWVKEVKGLTVRGYGPDDPGMKSLGYREIMGAMQSGSIHQTSLEEIIATKSVQYAKRQMTWWRRDGRIQWITP
ncbi:MAG: tRNA (adenosine(37)-N6)-dimethylallyltransferase MiaA [Candidatus Peribacteraceae bacterium]|nr:tRNA (adenosine(37)-N6)-dimethylallyltransferase MiaA [Candidatus Peribacteraceae bacterium]